jgi:hypothetical protein
MTRRDKAAEEIDYFHIPPSMRREPSTGLVPEVVSEPREAPQKGTREERKVRRADRRTLKELGWPEEAINGLSRREAEEAAHRKAAAP